MGNFLKGLLGTEPALILGLVQAGLTLAVVFGLKLDEGQTAAILAFVNILIAVLTRQTVVPVEKYASDVQKALYTEPPVSETLLTTDEAEAGV